MSVTVEELKSAFTDIIAADLIAKIDPAKPLTAQGMDSLALTTLAVAVQNKYKVKIPPEEGVKLKTLNDVVDFLNKAGA